MDGFFHDLIWCFIGVVIGGFTTPLFTLVLNRMGLLPKRVRNWLKKQLFSEEMARIASLEFRMNLTEEERRINLRFSQLGIQVPPTPGVIPPLPPK